MQSRRGGRPAQKWHLEVPQVREARGSVYASGRDILKSSVAEQAMESSDRDRLISVAIGPDILRFSLPHDGLPPQGYRLEPNNAAFDDLLVACIFKRQSVLEQDLN